MAQLSLATWRMDLRYLGKTLATSGCTERSQPCESGFAGDIWSKAKVGLSLCSQLFVAEQSDSEVVDVSVFHLVESPRC